MAGLGGSMMTAVLRASDLARARKFYSEVLGLNPGRPNAAGDIFTTDDGTSVLIYERPGMSAPQNTTLGFAVAPDDFDAVIAELRGRGAVFEEYDIPEMGLRTVDGVAVVDGVKSAWLKDTEGNILSIASM